MLTNYTKSNYNRETLLGIISKLYRIQGTSIIKPIMTGSKTVQQNDINRSNLIRGNDARAHIKTKIIIQVFSPKIIPFDIVLIIV